MGRLFDKYLISCAMQKVPFPSSWQDSLGLSMTKNAQLRDSSPVTGFNFQRDGDLQRGYELKDIVDTLKSNKYTLQLYLAALKEHKGLDYLRYLSLVDSKYEDGYYISTIPVIHGLTYSVMARTTLPIELTYYSEIMDSTGKNTIFDNINFCVTRDPYIYDTSAIDVEGHQKELEYFRISVKSLVRTQIFCGYSKAYQTDTTELKLGFDSPNYTVPEGQRLAANLTPTKPFINSLVNGGEYSDKLIPCLLDMQITQNSPQPLIDNFLSRTVEVDLETAISSRTTGGYDIDEYLGGKFRW